MDDEVESWLAPLREWRDAVSGAPIPRSARSHADALYEELAEVARRDEPGADELRASLASASGTDRRARVLRILARLGWVDRAVAAVTAARQRRHDDESR